MDLMLDDEPIYLNISLSDALNMVAKWNTHGISKEITIALNPLTYQIWYGILVFVYTFVLNFV